jgi:hypothetical protein
MVEWKAQVSCLLTEPSRSELEMRGIILEIVSSQGYYIVAKRFRGSPPENPKALLECVFMYL